MANFKSPAAFAAEMDRFLVTLEREKRRAFNRDLAEKAQKIADRAAMNDLGSDRAFSGWRRKGPIPLDTQIKSGRGGAAILMPERKTAGPWTVAERGRNGEGGVGLFQGPGVNLKSGKTMFDKQGNIRTTSRRQRKVRRFNGRTDGHDTATDAQRLMDRELPKVADKNFKAVLVKHFDVS